MSTFNPTASASSLVFTKLLTSLRDLGYSDDWVARQAKLTWVEHRELMKGMITKISRLYSSYGSTNISPEDSEKLSRMMSEMTWTMVDSKFKNQ